MNKFGFSFGLILGGLALGYLIQQAVRAGRITLPMELETLRKGLQKTALLAVLPFTVLSATWGVRIPHPAVAALPLIGFGAITLGGLAALGYARLFKLPAYQTGALYACGSFTNIGAIGALVCFVFLGEQGFALVPIYKIFEELTYYTIGFPVTKYFSTKNKGTDESTLHRIKALTRDPFILAAVSSLLIGGLLNWSGAARPQWVGPLNRLLIPLGTVLLIVSIGLAMRFGSIRHYLKEGLAVASIKFCIVPLVMGMLAVGLGYGRIAGGLPLKVVIILTSMPVAFNALIPPSIYDLDLDLANACWFLTTTALAMVLPALLIVLRAL